jgi:plastocyanin
MTAFDSSNNESTHSVSVEVIVTSDGIPANNAPTITGTPATTVVEDSLYSFTPAANDVDPGETLTFSIVNKPSWALFSATTGALTGAPVHANVGITAGIVISVTDTSNANASLPAFTLSVVNGLLAGDVNGSGAVDLEDLYLVQEILAGRTPSQTIHTGADVNGDGNIGMEEALYILQRVSQIR